MRSTITDKKTGTREWSDVSHNIGVGCSHNCLYCYAFAGAQEYGRCQNRQDWVQERLKKSTSRIPRNKGTVMFPTTHDISPFYLPTAIIAIKGLLEAGNKVLIVSKPHYECILELCAALIDYKDKILFRFSIGSLDRDLAALWEPGAPCPTERAACLAHAHQQGFQTSVSMEPILAGPEDAIKTFRFLETWVSDKIWIGKMNQVNRRVAKTTPEIATACQLIQEQQSEEEILRLVKRLEGHPKVAWKDSIQEIIARYRNWFSDVR